MRIIVTNVGKIELIDDNSNYHNSNHDFSLNGLNSINRLNQRYPQNTIPLYSPQKKCIYENSNLVLPKRHSYSSNKNILKRNSNQSFLSKIGMNSINFSPINNEDDKNVQNIKIRHKRLNIPKLMVNKYNENKALTTNNNIEEVNSMNNSADISNSENDYVDGLPTPSKEPLYLKDILKTKNKFNVNSKYLQKQINVEDSSLINYLGSDRKINPCFVKKISSSNENQLSKLDKLCQVFFHKEKMDNKLQNEIKNKILNEYSKDKQFCGKNLKDMGSNLNNFRNLYKKLEVKKNNYDNFRKLFFMPPQ